ncbi:isoleucine--tRNA ligase [Methanofollis fontis]|uniref:Isoleucine--tRNA ligase n=1 Tax=Methanofollis fontis TaxID=2052832 RepID=A0A483CL27_9EURY|nr:isoleucine--tRNA ligase [Methanofollis fontis]TAJ43460.1 isoleucine--tRNA ligase [Methanofollis fontis]
MKEVTSSYDARAIESRVQEHWREDDTYRRVRDLRRSGRQFFFVDGPPYTTGHIHLGTAWNKILKDAILRYRRMCGYNVIERAGYDMHGLPIEVQVEHQLGFTSKKDIEAYGIDRFIERCRDFALENMAVMSDQFRDLGIWLDFENPYQTLRKEYIEAAWWTLQQAETNGMLEQGHRVVNWCPRCETAIADSEVEYDDATDPSIFVKFPVKDADGEYLVIWTTTPWTLPANVAVAAHSEITYALVAARKDGAEERLWIAEPLVEEVLRKGRYQSYDVIRTVSGTDLAGTRYESPLKEDVPAQAEIEHRVVLADYVALENTGLVHTAPGHGWDDYLTGVKYDLPVLCPVDGTGRFTRKAGTFAGQYVKDPETNRAVMDALGSHLLHAGRITHRYGHCWRCKTPIIFRATEQWFIRASEMRDTLLNEVARVTWYPDWAGSARFHDWVKEARDWCISRQRYWGIPIPVWKCDTCENRQVIGTIAELEEASGQDVKDPHRPYVDGVTIPCSCGGTMHRVSDIFDVWFDSAVASWATLGFPGEKEAFERYWPADFITEGQDQTRGWFYSQLGASTVAFGKAPYKSVLMHGFALDADGRKMSKSLGNVVAPADVIERFGVDILRLYILSANAPWDDMKFNWDGVKTVNRSLNILWNVYRFPLPYMALDHFAPATTDGDRWDDTKVRALLSAMPDEDRWILSRINTLTAEIESDLESLSLHRITRSLISFVLEDLSRWYLQIVRPRMWLDEDAPEKTCAYETVYYVLRRLVGLLAPFTPHLTEEIYANLRCAGDPESVHMTDWPGADAALIDTALEAGMAVVQGFDDAAATARQDGKRKLRWPVGEIVVVTESEAVRDAVIRLNDLCRTRANARQVRVISGHWERIGWQAEAVMRVLGPRFGKEAPRVKAAIEESDGTALRNALAESGTASAGGYEITPEMATFHEEMPEGVFAAAMEDAVVYVDVNLSPDLEAEGYAREVIRRLQEMRRQADLQVEENIRAGIAIGDARIAALVGEQKDLIAGEVRAAALDIVDGDAPSGTWEVTAEWEVEGVQMMMGLSRSQT